MDHDYGNFPIKLGVPIYMNPQFKLDLEYGNFPIKLGVPICMSL